jgi:two-component system nitrate/nitrite sensor histidine kinase NarX
MTNTNRQTKEPLKITVTDDNKERTVSSSSSIIARAGQIMAVIITLGVVGMIASMLVSESLSGDAAQINRAGALRMQAIRISRALVVNQQELGKTSQQATQVENLANALVISEITDFENRITHLFEGGLTSARKDQAIEKQYQLILTLWQNLKRAAPKISDVQQNIRSFDPFVMQIDQLVTLLQSGSEKKLALLRLIQGISLFALLIIAFVVLHRLNRAFIVPLKQLVTVAELAGKGDFSIKATYDSDNELGVLASTINRMSEELELTYQDYEQRVESKTKALIRSNRSLQVLYQAASRLASNDDQQDDAHIIEELEAALGLGKITIERKSAEVNDLSIEVSRPSFTDPSICVKRIEFPVEKPNQPYGSIVWHIPKHQQARSWQSKMLQAMADIVATAIDLEQQRNTQNRLLIVEERAVIARELHDSLAQSLSYLKVQMSLLTRKMQKEVSQENIEETITDIKDGLNAAYRQLRELLTTFRLKLDDPSLENALQGTVVEFVEKCQHKIDLQFQLPDNCLTPNQEIHVLQIIREALSNVHRHANASRAGVSLKLKNAKYQIEIWDDGVGIVGVSQQPGHFGLGIMQERAKSLQTKIHLKPGEPSGTRVLFEF